jgi:hypothetical protein
MQSLPGEMQSLPGEMQSLPGEMQFIPVRAGWQWVTFLVKMLFFIAKPNTNDSPKEIVHRSVLSALMDATLNLLKIMSGPFPLSNTGS